MGNFVSTNIFDVLRNQLFKYKQNYKTIRYLIVYNKTIKIIHNQYNINIEQRLLF